MTQRLRFQLSEMSPEAENENLKNLLENYINRSEELEKKESHVISQVELLQSALASLQAWNKENASKMSTTPVRIKVKEIEEETQKIRQETQRIQEEVRQKIEENKRLQDEINRRKILETGKIDEYVTDNFLLKMEEETRRQKLERDEIESRALSSTKEEPTEDPGISFFNEKLRILREMEKKLKEESNEEEKERRKKRRELRDKIEKLEWESQVDRQLIKNLKKKFN